MSAQQPKPVVLCILDGWGHQPTSASSAIARANTPTYDRLVAEAPFATLNTSGQEVGLPDGQMGNSEVGHMNLGSGRVVLQDLPMIDAAAADGSLMRRPALTDMIAKVQTSGGTVHIMGLLSPGGVHSHQDHMVALAKGLRDQNVPVAIHGFLDGRDTPPSSAREFVAKFEMDLGGCDAPLATLTGRFYAMDRDKRWDRVEKAFRGMAFGEGTAHPTATLAMEAAYQADETDEFVTPRILGGYAGMKDGDVILMANFRADRAREILTVFTDPAFDGFDRGAMPHFADVCGLVEYSAALRDSVSAMFPPENPENTLGEFLAAQGRKQLHIAETEKYAHVTFFFNGGREEPFAGEERILVPSPKVATYDLQPEMSAGEVTDRLVTEITKGGHDFIVVNYANPDMVGHTGVMSAAVKAVETIDGCLARLEDAVTQAGGVMLVTADHGNVEQMHDDTTNGPHTAHTTFEVPFVLVNAAALPGDVTLRSGRLADVAPTVLSLMGLTPPKEMTGRVLVENAGQGTAVA
ncbi:MAG: 2,3-bisphosphoglycerate-independent phosphoglycerate mutase [Alphaproteobacteria bacterium]